MYLPLTIDCRGSWHLPNRSDYLKQWRQPSSRSMVGRSHCCTTSPHILMPSQDLSPEARILYSSDSIVDILGYAPNEVVNRSCWDFFHPDEIPVARAAHGRSIELDKAAVLSYCRMRDKEGHWLGCEIVFTIVYNVMVGCTSIYRRGLKSQSMSCSDGKLSNSTLTSSKTEQPKPQ